VIVDISSKDVIHSFNVPVLRVKQDTIPGQQIRSGSRPRRPATSSSPAPSSAASATTACAGRSDRDAEEFAKWEAETLAAAEAPAAAAPEEKK